jgi:hypothetical protein
MEGNDNHIILSCCHLPVSCRSLVDRCGSFGNSKPQILNLIFVPFIQRLHFFSKNFLFLFLFLCYPYFGNSPFQLVLFFSAWYFANQIIKWKQTYNLCLGKFTLSDLKRKTRAWTRIRTSLFSWNLDNDIFFCDYQLVMLCFRLPWYPEAHL